MRKRWFLIKKGTRTVDPVGDKILSNINTYAFTFSDEVRKKMTILFGTKTFQIEK